MLNTPQSQHRQPRGSYAKLICLNCRARKIKCILPDHIQLEPSQSPQPSDRACTRCQQQGLDCVVDKTILGRPSQKRPRAETTRTEDDDFIEHAGPEEPEEGFDVQDFVLSDLREEVNEIGSVVTTPPKAKPSKREVFEALMDSTHLFSNLMAGDARFGSRAFGLHVDMSMSLTQLVSESLAASMDERLVWHRLISPWLPTLTDLRREILSSGELSLAPYTKALFALLSLIALDVPSKALAVSPSLWQQLHCLVRSFCQTLLFSLPVHRHALYVLALVDTYKPLALASGRSVAATSLKGNLSTTLAKRTAQKLGFNNSAHRLRAMLDDIGKHRKEAIIEVALEALQWCRWLMMESIIDGFVLKPVVEQSSPVPEVIQILSAVKRAVDTIPLSPAILLMYHHLSSASIEMQAAVAAKRNWLDLSALSRLIESHAKKCKSHRDQIRNLLESCDRSKNAQAEEEVNAAIKIRTLDLSASHVRIAGLCIFYGLMSGLRPPGTDRDVTPDEAMQISSEIISNLTTKHDTLSDPTSVASFIAKHGDPRFQKIEQTLRDFITTADTLRLKGIPYQPASVPTVSGLLSACREIVENNATRLKGWGGLHPSVDVHLLLLQDVAKRLEGMDAAGGGPDAVAKGSIHASGAKLIKSLCKIVADWRKTIAEREVKEAATKGVQAQTSIPAEFEGVDMFLSGELLDDWAEWPQAEDLDFSELLADGLEWVDWAQLFPPCDEGNLF